MANIPIKWGKVGTDGKAEVNGADNTTFSSSSPAFKVNGDEEITGDSSVGGGQSITGNSSVGGNQTVTGNGSIGGNGTISGNLIVYKDNTTNKVGINVASPTEALDVSGNIKVSGNVTAGGNIVSSGGDLSLGTTGSGSDDSGDIVWYYGNGQEKARLWTDNTYSATKGLNYRVYKSDGTLLASGSIPTSDTNTTYTIATGDSNGQIKVTPSSGSAYNVGVKGLGSAAYKNYAEANTASTVVARNANNYIYATYYNAACGNDNGATSGSYALYVNSDNWIRKCSMSKMYSALGGSGCVSLYNGNLAPNSQTTFNYGSYSAYVIFFRIDGNDKDFNMFIVPKGKIGTTADAGYTEYDPYNWVWIQMWYSGSTCYCKFSGASNGNARIKWIYGLY